MLSDFYYVGAGVHGYGPHLSIGWNDSPYDDDWAVRFGDGVYAFALDVVDSNEQVPALPETFKVYGADDVLLGALDSTDPRWPAGAKTFFGIISTEPVARVFFDDEAGTDNIGLGKIWLTPEPTTLLMLGVLTILRRR